MAWWRGNNREQLAIFACINLQKSRVGFRVDSRSSESIIVGDVAGRLKLK